MCFGSWAGQVAIAVGEEYPDKRTGLARRLWLTLW
jgi:hypothetical protein